MVNPKESPRLMFPRAPRPAPEAATAAARGPATRRGPVPRLSPRTSRFATPPGNARRGLSVTRLRARTDSASLPGRDGLRPLSPPRRARADASVPPGSARRGPAAPRRRRAGLLPPAAAFALVFALLLLAPAPATRAQSRVDGEIDAFNTLIWDGQADELGFVGLGRGRLDLRAERDRNIQARLTLDALLGETRLEEGAVVPQATLSVPRASVRFRFPVTEEYTLRVTAGRDRVSWGSGSLFNAADVIFGADGTATADFFEVSDDLRDETTWLTAVYLPLGDFSYFEPIVLPPMPSPLTGDGAAGGSGNGDGAGTDGTLPATRAAPSISQTRAGARLNFEAGTFTFEPGYLYDGPRERHELVLSTQALIGIDVYGGARISLDGDIDESNLDERTAFSSGAYHRFRLNRDTTLDARLEALVRPGAQWEDQNQSGTDYALALYPELILIPGRTVSLVARSVVSPIDLSAQITTGVQWNVFGGFNMLAFGSVQAGEQNDTFGFDRPGSASLTTGFSYKF